MMPTDEPISSPPSQSPDNGGRRYDGNPFPSGVPQPVPRSATRTPSESAVAAGMRLETGTFGEHPAAQVLQAPGAGVAAFGVVALRALPPSTVGCGAPVRQDVQAGRSDECSDRNENVMYARQRTTRVSPVVIRARGLSWNGSRARFLSMLG